MAISKLRQDFDRALRPQAAPRPLPSPAWLQQAIMDLRRHCLHLKLPRLSMQERARLIRSDKPGLPELLLGLQHVLDREARSAAVVDRTPALAQAVGVSAQDLIDLQKKDVALHSACQRAAALRADASRGEQRAGRALQEVCAALLRRARALRDAPDTAPDKRSQAVALLAAVARYDQRLAVVQQRRQQRQAQRRAAHQASALVAAAAQDGVRALAVDPPDAELRGEPLERCLAVAPALFQHITQKLAEIAAPLGSEGPVEAPDDYLYTVDLGALLHQTLQEQPELQRLCDGSPDALWTLCQQVDDCALLADSAHRFATMASDAHLWIAARAQEVLARVLQVLQAQAQDLQRAPAEREAAAVDRLSLLQVCARGEERQRDRQARADRRVAAAVAEAQRSREAPAPRRGQPAPKVARQRVTGPPQAGSP